MGKKYIVEIGRLERLYKAYVNGNGKPNMTWLSPEVDLTPYTEPDLEQVRKEWYEKGLSDAWEAARKIQDTGGNLNWWIHNTSASDAIEKIRQYEQEKEEQIQVGDEVENTQTGVKFTVTHLWENNRGEQGVSGFNQECSAFSATLSLVVKTGQHFPEVAAIFDKMRES